MTDLTFGPPRDDADRRRFAALSEYAFWEEPAAEPEIGWLAEGGPSIVRLARRDDRVVGGAIVVPAAQWFGGRAVPLALIGAVSVAPEHRGGGTGTAIVADYLRLARDAGLAISSLYPASYPLYHRSGYEHAGAVVRYDLPVASLVGRPVDDGVTVREHDGDDATLKAIYDRFARQTPGLLQRLDLHWGGILGPRGRQAVHRYVAERDGEPLGYLVFTQRHVADGRLLEVWDFAVTERPAAHALLAFLGAHRHNVTTVRLRGGPNDPRLIDVPQPGASVSALEPWMLRVLDVRAALEARGYPAGVTAELHLDHHDDQLPENTGRWLVRVAGGRATVEPGGEGRIRTTARGLSGVYAGAFTAESLAAPPHLAAAPDDLAQLTSAFAGPPPWMANHF